MMELSNRLRAVADMVSPGMRLADIGTDHGYVPIYLTEQGRVPFAIAMDINKGPLERADEHIKEAGLTEKIQTRLSNGLQQLEVNEVDTMIAAGMGGGLVIMILTEGAKVAHNLKEIILQPQSEIRKVREFLLTSGYEILDENMIFEDGKYYPMMKATYRGVEQSLWDREELEYGKFLLAKKDPVLKSFLEKELQIQEDICRKLEEQTSGRSKERREQITQDMNWIRQILKERFSESFEEADC